MENIKTWANTHSWVKIAVYLLTFLFPALAFAQFYLPLLSVVNMPLFVPTTVPFDVVTLN